MIPTNSFSNIQQIAKAKEQKSKRENTSMSRKKKKATTLDIGINIQPMRQLYLLCLKKYKTSWKFSVYMN